MKHFERSTSRTFGAMLLAGIAARARLVLVAATLVVASLACAQPYPSKQLWIIVPYGAGGAVDIVARTIAQELAPRLEQPVLVDNRVGQGGNIGSAYVAKSKPDGYTLLMGAPTNTVAHRFFADLPYDPAKDLTPIALVASAPAVLLVPAGSPARDLAALVALAKAKPGELSYGHGGIGTTSEHLAAEFLKTRTGLSLVGVPYKGGAPALQDLIGGRLDMMFTNQLNALPHLKSGRLRALAVASPERSPALPDVATMAEQGFHDFNVLVWWGLMGPANMPPEIVSRLNREVGEALDSASMKERLAALSAQPMKRTPEEFSRFFHAEMRQWEEVVKRAGIKPQ
jgi:tripartite-type tricarboxylate transporter receptor subunit TctC